MAATYIEFTDRYSGRRRAAQLDERGDGRLYDAGMCRVPSYMLDNQKPIEVTPIAELTWNGEAVAPYSDSVTGFLFFVEIDYDISCGGKAEARGYVVCQGGDVMLAYLSRPHGAPLSIAIPV